MKTVFIYFSITLLVIYYLNVLNEAFKTFKYYNSPIKTKKDLFFALIPFQIYVKQLIFVIKNLN